MIILLKPCRLDLNRNLVRVQAQMRSQSRVGNILTSKVDELSNFLI